MNTYESSSEQENELNQSHLTADRSAVADGESFYTLEGPPEPEDEEVGWSASFVHPFQASAPLPIAHAFEQAGSIQASSSARAVQRNAQLRQIFPWKAVILIGMVILIAMGGLSLGVFASVALLVARGSMMPPAHQTLKQPSPTRMPQVHPAITPTQVAVDWGPQNLPPGWTNAGLSTGDALFALRTAMTFTDREMSLDYRNVGSRAHHSGTFTAAVFILTPAAQVRFAQNDVRVANNALFDAVEQQQLIQVVVNAQPRLIAFQMQGQQR